MSRDKKFWKEASKPKGGLKTRKVVEVSDLEVLRNLDREKVLPLLQPREEELRTLISSGEPPPQKMELSEEEKALVESRQWAQKVVVGNERVRKTLGAMIAMRRSYAVAYRELQEALAQEKEVPVTGEDYMILAAMHQSSQPFDEHELMHGYLESVLPWIADVIDRHATDDVDEAHKEAKLKEEQRQTKRVPLGFLLDLESSEPSLPREKSMVLIGWVNAVRFVMDKIMDCALAGEFCVVRMYALAPKGKDENVLLVRLPADVWRGIANKGTQPARVMTLHVAERLEKPVDLVVCENLPAAFTAGFYGRPAAANAGDAHKGLRKWCDAAGAAFVGGVFLEDKDIPDLSVPEYEQLKTFTTMRAVRVVASNEVGKVRVNVLGSLHYWDVDEDVLAGYGTGSLLTLPDV